MIIRDWVVISNAAVVRNNLLLAGGSSLPAEALYAELKCGYPKFYKMDILCKWAWLGAEYMLENNGVSYAETATENIGIVLATSHGCLDVDKRFAEGMTMPSPALFVYTLTNIMLGEICIRHGFKGEQLCMATEKFDATETYLIVKDLVENKGMDAVLCGWADVSSGQHDVCLFWVVKGGEGLTFSPGNMQEIYRAV